MRFVYIMVPLLSNSQPLKVVIALVVLFVGWLIASMIPRSETPWDKTSSSFLARRPVTDADGNSVEENSEYNRLWNQNGENLGRDGKHLTIDYDSAFFGQGDETEAGAENAESTELSDSQTEDLVRSWSDEIKIDSDEPPEVKIDERPKWDDDAVFDSPVADPRELAPPMEPLNTKWENEPESGSEADESAPETDVADNADSGKSPEENRTASDPSGESAVKDEPLTAQAESSLIDQESAPSGGPDQTEPIPPEQSLDDRDALAKREPTPLPGYEQPEVSSGAAESSGGDLIPLPTQRPSEQVADPQTGAPSAENPESPAVKTLTPSSGTRAAVEPSTPADSGPIRQAGGELPNGSDGYNSRNAYYLGSNPTEVPAPAEQPTVVSGPTAVSVYTAGAGENWDGVAAKFGLSDAEKARYYEDNSFRINSDGTLTEGMKLILPKR